MEGFLTYCCPWHIPMCSESLACCRSSSSTGRCDYFSQQKAARIGTLQKYFFSPSSNLLQKAWGRNFLFLLMVLVTYVLNLYKTLASSTVITNYPWKYGSLCAYNFPFSTISLQLYRLSHVSGWHPYLQDVLNPNRQNMAHSNLFLNHTASTVWSPNNDGVCWVNTASTVCGSWCLPGSQLHWAVDVVGNDVWKLCRHDPQILHMGHNQVHQIQEEYYCLPCEKI